MPNPKVSPVTLQRIHNSDFQENVDLLAVEEPLEIRIGYGPSQARKQKAIAVTMRTPGNDLELAAGFLFTEGIIRSLNDIRKIDHCRATEGLGNADNIVRVELQPSVQFDVKMVERHFYISSSCGVCGKASIESLRISGCPSIYDNGLVIDRAVIHKLPDLLRKNQNVFEHTGGLHAAALFNRRGELLLLSEDVGRHNALDKLVGALLFSRMMPLSNSLILVSGRASFELVQKGLMAGTPIMAAVGAPSSLAVALAGEFGMTLIGFVRNKRYNVYTYQERVMPLAKGVNGRRSEKDFQSNVIGECR